MKFEGADAFIQKNVPLCFNFQLWNDRRQHHERPIDTVGRTLAPSTNPPPDAASSRRWHDFAYTRRGMVKSHPKPFARSARIG